MRLRLTAIAIVLLSSSWALALTSTTVSFQNGIGGYTGTYDRYIASIPDSGADGSAFPDVNLIGSTQQGLIRFDNIFGSGPGQIPLGARILDASLQLSTIGGADTNLDNTNGPYAVAGLTNPFNNTTVYSSYSGGNGAWFENGHTTRPQGNFGRLDGGETQATDIRSIVQAWSDGGTNNGMAINGGIPTGTDTWRIQTTGNTSPGSRPKLSVTYTTDSVAVTTFQRGTNGTVDSERVTSKCNTDGSGTGCAANPGAFTNTDGNSLGSMTLQLADATSAEQFALFRFNDMFGSNAGQAPLDKPVQKAFLVLTTLNSSNTSARIPAPVDAYEMNTSWTIAKTFDQFGANIGLQSGDGDIKQETLYRTPSAGNDSEIWFDVTGYAERIRTGATNNGIAIQARSTDGWQFQMNNAGTVAVRPRLVVMSDLSAVGSLPGDFNNDTTVDARDYTAIRKQYSDISTGAGLAAYTAFRQNFGNSGSGPAPPQPTAVLKYDASPKNGVLTGAINNSTVALVTLPAAPTPTGTLAIDMSRGTGLTPAGLTNGYSSSGWAGADLAAAVAGNDYHEFGFTLDATHTASLSKLDMTMRRGAADGPSNFEVHASFDNFLTAPIVVPFSLSQTFFTYLGRADGDAPTIDPSLDTPFYYMTNDQAGRPNTTFSSTDPIPTIDLSTVAALQNIPAGTTVKFRLYGWGASTETGTFGFRVAGPKITGVVSATSGFGSGASVPEPSTALLAGVCATIFAAGRRRRSCL